MSDAETEQEAAPLKRSKMPMILGIALALAGAGGGFYATWSGMILAPEDAAHAGAPTEVAPAAMPDVAFVPVEPLVVSLPAPSEFAHLRFSAQLEVPSAYRAEVETLLPRVTDVFNSYLRALEPANLEDRSALTRLRSQLLRRVQIVAGQGRVNDLLIMEFVLN
jgi:flagellar protein FliL